MKQVFISHSGEPSLALAAAVQQQLVNQGYEPWPDVTELKPGTDLAIIHSALDRAGAGIVLLDPNGLRSEWLHHELSILQEKWVREGTPLLVVLKGASLDQADWTIRLAAEQCLSLPEDLHDTAAAQV